MPRKLWISVLALGCGAAGSDRYPPAPSAQVSSAAGPCSEEMVLVAGRLCVDRYEVSMVDHRTGKAFSPFYPASLDEMRKAVNGQAWGRAALGGEQLDPPVPLLPDWQREPSAKARAVSRKRAIPQGYLSKLTAKAACEAAGKRLCSLEEWRLACRGESNTQFPYGSTYRHKACNVRRQEHAAFILWGNASIGHWDPRLNQLPVDGAPLLKATGEADTCRSRWGADGIYDMVGNLDEWVEDPKATFAGGFYARDTVRGCDAKVSVHPAVYFDYSTGVRCCSDARAIR